MGAAVSITRVDLTASELRNAASGEKDSAATGRIALALVLDGVDCQSAPEGAMADDDLMSIDLPRRWLSRLLDERGCGRVGPYIARAVHNPEQWGGGRDVAERVLSDQLFGSLPPKRPQQTLHNRLLSRPELLGAFLAQPAYNCECS